MIVSVNLTELNKIYFMEIFIKFFLQSRWTKVEEVWLNLFNLIKRLEIYF